MVKEQLQTLHNFPVEYSVIFSGKKSKKVNVLYKPGAKEIIIHNKNFFERGAITYGKQNRGARLQHASRGCEPKPAGIVQGRVYHQGRFEDRLNRGNVPRVCPGCLSEGREKNR
jgi:hypothetical protein